MAIHVKAEKFKVGISPKGHSTVSIFATDKPQMLGGWHRVHGDAGTHYFAEAQIESYSVKTPVDSAALDSEPSNGQYSGITPEMASYKASRLTEAAVETGRTVQLYKHLSVLLPIIQSAERNG